MATKEEREMGGWTVGLAVFAGAIMVMVGIFQAFEGLVALFDSGFYVMGANYTYTFDITTWGWTHLLLGIVVTLAGLAVFSGATWGRVVGIILAALSAIGNFFFIPYYPFWSILIIVLDIAVIGALSIYNPKKYKQTMESTSTTQAVV